VSDPRRLTRMRLWSRRVGSVEAIAGLVVGAGVVLAAVIVAVRQLGSMQVAVVERTAEAMWGPRTVTQPEAVPLEQPEQEPPMFPPWEEEPWSMTETPGPVPLPTDDSPN
jgi:hypothetical protein